MDTHTWMEEWVDAGKGLIEMGMRGPTGRGQKEENEAHNGQVD